MTGALPRGHMLGQSGIRGGCHLGAEGGLHIGADLARTTGGGFGGQGLLGGGELAPPPQAAWADLGPAGDLSY